MTSLTGLENWNPILRKVGFKAFEPSGFLEDCIIAVTADHGEAFFEHGLQGHRHSVFEEEVRIPLLIRYPKKVAAGCRIAQPVHITDVGPTLLEMAGLPPLEAALGVSLIPLLQDPALAWPDRKDICEIHDRDFHVFAIRTRQWKYQFALTTRRMRVYDLLHDPDEQQALPESRYPMPPEAVNDLYVQTVKNLRKAANRLPPIGERDTPAIGKMTEAQLKSLGYLK